MSYAPIYSKLHELENRLVAIESSPKQSEVVSAVSSSVSYSEFDSSGLRKEIQDLLNVVSGLATKAELPDVSGLATKEELPDVSGLATKAELPDVSGLATKEELTDVSGLATKEDFADILNKFDNLINVVSQLNIKIDEANAKISALEGS